jgi:hypothetical protein
MSTKLRPSALTALFVIAAAGAAPASPSLESGRPFPLIPLPLVGATGDYELHTLADFRGHKTVVHIFAGW